MTLILYEQWEPKPQSEALVAQANLIIQEYEEAGYVLTLRQLYYQFVARGIIPNTERSYKNLGNLVTKGRNAGMISWDAIEDRNRENHRFHVQENPREVLRRLEHHVQFDYWLRQPYYVEVWIEKEALGNVLEGPCRSFRVPHMACKGYLSASEAWRAGQRFQEARERGQEPLLIHLGDHDPSGINMTEDNGNRLFTYSGHEPVEVRRIALNMDQVEEFSPPPNPAKIKDSRLRSYSERFGDESWELDALEPAYIEELITREITSLIDSDLWAEVEVEEAAARTDLSQLHGRWDEITQWLEDNPREDADA